MKMINQNIDSYRALNEIFTTNNFNKIVRLNDIKSTQKSIVKYCHEIENPITYKSVINKIYYQLENKYRTEYFFKNKLFNKYLLEKYSVFNTTAINEFKIGGSIADFLLLNGSAKIFEIKTDLDNLNKLDKQLSDYCQFADFVYIVTSNKFIEKILSKYAKTSIGVIEFTENKTLKEHKKPKSNSLLFDYEILFKTLRKSEYLDIINTHFGSIPRVPNTQIFKRSLELTRQIEIKKFQKMVVAKLKSRKLKCPNLLQNNKTPYALKQICCNLDFSESEYNKLYNFLNKTV